jgi:hypothetical protein
MVEVGLLADKERTLYTGMQDENFFVLCQKT